MKPYKVSHWHSQELDSLETEAKYVIPSCRTTAALRILERYCDPDPKFPYGVISSIYYDSRCWDYLQEKRNSDYLKTKVRLRWYEDTGSSAASDDRSFIEIKCRVGSKRTKRRVATEYRGADLGAMALHDRALLKIPAALVAIGAPIHYALFPAFIVRYCRRRYVDRTTRMRMCIDYAITAPKVNKHMIANPFQCAIGYSVIEMKGTDRHIPFGLKSALKLGFRWGSFSKYFECYRHLTGTLF